MSAPDLTNIVPEVVEDFPMPQMTPDPPENKQNSEPENERPAIRRRRGAFVKPVTQIYGGAAMALAPFDPECAQILAQSAPDIAKAWDDLAYENDNVRRVLAALAEGSAVGALIFAHLPIVAAVVSHHAPGIRSIVSSATDKMASRFASREDNE